MKQAGCTCNCGLARGRPDIHMKTAWPASMANLPKDLSGHCLFQQWRICLARIAESAWRRCSQILLRTNPPGKPFVTEGRRIARINVTALVNVDSPAPVGW